MPPFGARSEPEQEFEHWDADDSIIGLTLERLARHEDAERRTELVDEAPQRCYIVPVDPAAEFDLDRNYRAVQRLDNEVYLLCNDSLRPTPRCAKEFDPRGSISGST